MPHFGPTRRSLLQGTIAASALGLTGFPARAEVQWKKYAGTTIEANLIKAVSYTHLTLPTKRIV